MQNNENPYFKQYNNDFKLIAPLLPLLHIFFSVIYHKGASKMSEKVTKH